MQININLKKDFETFLQHLNEEYGEDFADLNGLSEKHLSFNDFIENFVDKDTVADASVDGSSNVHSKDIVTLRSEMSKPHEKLLAYHKIFYEMKKEYGLRKAKKWLELEWTKGLYLHDANTASFMPYCYKGENIVSIKYKDVVYKTTFEQLYELLNNNEELVFDSSISQEAFFPSELYVLDTNNTWTKVTRVLQHANNLPMRFIKLSNGRSITVTDNHPVITRLREIQAKDVNIGDEILVEQDTLFDNTLFIDEVSYLPKGCKISTTTEDVELSADFGWLVGFILAEGSIDKYGFSFKQNKGLYLDKALDILDKLNIPYIIDEFDDSICCLVRIKTNKYSKWIADRFKGQTSENKQLPPEYVHYNYSFLNGCLCGFSPWDKGFGIS